ncbi:MAG TPA: 4Fe-4S binding protein [Clostridia bacterium]|nr:4Fe-4S binding protein [Clostridia bacterium]HPQ45927.1 4Fe-4S binding protein [Clostridia bacterium]HRX41244.1 4Fe-4S binding protein [Clostridia bacterium]
MNRLKTEFDGLILDNPLMPASGPLTGDLEKMKFIQEQGVGAVVTKTISVKAARVPRPCIYGDRSHVMNSELWSEFPMEKWTDEILPEFMKIKTKPLIVSMGYTREDMEILVPRLDAFADAFEVSTHYVGKDLSVISNTVRAIRSNTKKPIYMKISPHIPEPVKFAEAVREAGATGVAAINSLGPTMNINISKRSLEYCGESGFVWTSGPVIRNLALGIVYTIKKALPDFTVIGTGGVQNADDILQFLLAGASGVQMLSGALLKGKDLYSKIIKELPAVLDKYGFSDVKEVYDTGLSIETVYEPTATVLDEDKCTHCRLCERICPYFAITYDEKIIIDKDKCFGCGLCISKCPVGALS